MKQIRTSTIFRGLLISLFVGLTFFSAYSHPIQAQTNVTVNPKLGPLKCKANADDPAIWINPTDKSKSLMFLSDKDAGFCVFDFNGTQIQYFPLSTSLNNIDLRYGFNFGGQQIDVLVANLRGTGKLGVWKVNPNWTTNNAVTMLSGPTSTGNTISSDSYGFTAYKRPSDGKLYVFDKSKSSAPIKQWLVDGSSGNIIVTLVRTINDVSINVAEGFVADDELGYVYFAEEAATVIHKYNADPDHAIKTRVGVFGSGTGIAADLEGISLYKCNDGTGYLLASSQGNSTFKVFERQGNNAFKKTFTAAQSSGTDGMDSNSAGVSATFPAGFAVIHNDPPMNYFIYDWRDIAGTDLRVCANGGSGGPTQPPQPTITSIIIGDTLTCDVVIDGKCDIFDFNAIVANFGKTGSAINPLRADIIKNQTVDIFDFNAMVAGFGRSL